MGKRGPTPMSQRLRVIRGDGRPSRAKSTIEAAIAPTVPEPPAWLSKDARDEWLRVSPALHGCGLLSILDLQPFAAWCAAVARWKSACEALQRLPEDERLFSPLAKVCRDAGREMQRLGAPLGLAGPNSRARLTVAVKQAPGKFEGLLGRSDEPA
jgi:P27 family predicted phage terminase small subunit